MPQGYLLFHLNLAFSSIKTELRPQVIEKCYWPLLRLVEQRDMPIGIELTGWTLQQIATQDPQWVRKFAELLKAGRCELIGSGWTQMIGPLAPFDANRWNQRLGLEAYRRLLDTTPAIVLVNEMAYSTGMVDVYAEAGYRGLVMDRDNVRLALGLAGAPLSATPTHALGCGEAGDATALPVLWGDSILFQSLQRVVHGDKPMADYLAYVARRAARDGTVLPIYCNDAEIFDFRPGRFTTEAVLDGDDSEWARLSQLCDRLEGELGLQWLSPSAALAEVQARLPRQARRLSSVAQPIPVKKQAKYNINRWSVTGRDDLALNSDCHRFCTALQASGSQDPEDWRALCELWASDLRTHITDARWQQASERRAAWLARLGPAAGAGDAPPAWTTLEHFAPPDGVTLTLDDSAILLQLQAPGVALTLNLRRGLTIASLGFASAGGRPVIGTLDQGYFDSIELGADFYSGGVLLESPVSRQRLADLEWVVPEFAVHDGQLLLRARLRFADGQLEKRIGIDLATERVTLGYHFDGVSRPLGSLRVAVLTLLHEHLQEPLRLHCTQGGPAAETFVLDQPATHAEPASTLVSSTAGFGATDGRLVLEDARGPLLALHWDPTRCAAVPMLSHRHASPAPFTRLKFSLAELDDTARAGGSLRDFELTITPR